AADYTVSYSGERTNAGTFNLILTGQGNYHGTRTIPVTINKADQNITITDPGVKTFGDAPFTLDVSGGTPSFEVTSGTAVSVDASTGLVTIIRAGAATITVSMDGNDNYNNVLKDITLTVARKNIAAASIDISGTYTYNGSHQSPSMTVTLDGVTLVNPFDYTVTQVGGTSAGTPIVTINAQNNYTGSVSETFTINPFQLSWIANGTIHNKEYDRTNVAAVNALPALNTFGADIVTVSQGTTTFASVNVGTGIAVTAAGWGISGNSNYIAPAAQPSFWGANITPKPLEWNSCAVADKPYDGTNSATITTTPTLLAGRIIDGDTVTVTPGTAVFSNVNASSDQIEVTASGWGIAGVDAGNYSIEQPNFNAAYINPRTLGLSFTGPPVALSPLNTNVNLTSNINLIGLVVSETVPISLSDGVVVSYDDATKLLTYSNADVPVPARALAFTANAAGTGYNSNYTTVNATFNITVHDGKGSGTRAIPVTQENIVRTSPIDFNTFANTAGSTDGLSRHYVLAENITLTGPNNWIPIGTTATPFIGSFDGNNRTITGITISGTNSNQGMFGVIGSFNNGIEWIPGIVKNLTLNSVNIIGASDIGGIAGINRGLIEYCNVSGTITGTGNNVGGIAGSGIQPPPDVPAPNSSIIRYCISNAMVSGSNTGAGGVVGSASTGTNISNCFSTGDIKGLNNVGGIVGSIKDSSVSNCYSTSNVEATITGMFTFGSVGGITGLVDNSQVTNCVALNPKVSFENEPMPDAIGRIAGNATGLNNNFAFSGMIVTVNSVPKTLTGETPTGINGGAIINDLGQPGHFATLWQTLGFTNPWWTAVPGRLPNLGMYLSDAPIEGDGTTQPFRIYNEHQLRQVGRGASAATGYTAWTLDSNYELMGNITLTGDTNNWTAIGPFDTPSGTDTPFTGIFDGQGFTISNIQMSGHVQHQGFFGKISGAGAVIRNLHLVGNISTSDIVVGGIVADHAGGLIENCSFTGTVSGTGILPVRTRAGGITATTSRGGTVRRCVFNGTVQTTGHEAGGIVGYVNMDGNTATIYCTIENNLSIGTVRVTGTPEINYGSAIGGIIGSIQPNGGIVRNNISMAIVEGDNINRAGGIVGRTGYRFWWDVPQVINYQNIIENNIALNTRVSSQSPVCRVAGEINASPAPQSIVRNNYAWAGMPIGTNAGSSAPVTSGDANSLNGADIIGGIDGNIATIRALFTDPWWDARFPDLTEYLFAGASLELDECLFCGLDFDECECVCFLCYGLDECECDCLECYGLDECECDDDIMGMNGMIDAPDDEQDTEIDSSDISEHINHGISNGVDGIDDGADKGNTEPNTNGNPDDGTSNGGSTGTGSSPGTGAGSGNESSTGYSGTATSLCENPDCTDPDCNDLDCTEPDNNTTPEPVDPDESSDTMYEFLFVLPITGLGEFLRRRKIIRLPYFKRILSKHG
ncbi:MAG: YDG domain-containing protein, partial [Oscillospiraceae bacterium]|nr:YDG domain-containing protein [Oscillospiraceae bacterium]